MLLCRATCQLHLLHCFGGGERIARPRDRGGERDWLVSQGSNLCPDQVTVRGRGRNGDEQGAGFTPRSQVCLGGNAIQPHHLISSRE